MADGCVYGDDVCEDFLSDTLGDIIDKENIGKIKRDILNNIKERKRQRKACNKEAIFNDFQINENIFCDCVKRLVDEGLLKATSTKAGKIVYSPVRTNRDEDDTNKDFYDDFVEFKQYVSEALAVLDERMENNAETASTIVLRTEVENLKSEVGTKDIIISFLREEINHLRSENIKLLDIQHKTQCCVTSKNSLHDVTNFNLLHESFAEATAVEKSDNRLMNETIKFNVEQQLNDVRKQLKSRYENSIDSARNNGTKSLSRKNNVENNDDLNCSKNTSLDRNKEKRKNVIICGDSILNGIDSTGLSTKDHKTVVRNFPGATSKDMCTYIKPLVEKKPNKMIIHVGTNDLTNNVETISNLKSIHEYIKSNSKETEVVFSKLCIRDDKRHIIAKVDRLNAEIETFCSRENIKSIDHRNINKDSLSRKKLHLNRKGLTHLAMNFKNHVAQN